MRAGTVKILMNVKRYLSLAALFMALFQTPESFAADGWRVEVEYLYDLPAYVLFNDNPVITFSDEFFILSSASTKLEIPIDNLLNYKVSKTTGMSLPDAIDNGIKIEGRTISLAQGCPIDVLVYDLKGQIVYSAKADGSVTGVTLDTLSKGTYIVKVNSYTFKIHLYE